MRKINSNYTFTKGPLSYISLILLIFFFIIKFKNIYEPIQVGIYFFMIFAGIYTMYDTYIKDKKNNTNNLKHKITVIILLLLLFALSYLVIPSFFKV
jgi:hypothetical protein